jgi:hypothetical protein
MVKVEVTGFGAKVVTEMLAAPRILFLYGVFCGELATIPLLVCAKLGTAFSVSWLDGVGLRYQLPMSFLCLALWYAVLRVDVTPHPRRNLHASYSYFCCGFLIGISAITWMTAQIAGFYDPLALALLNAFFWTGIPFGIYFVAEAVAEGVRWYLRSEQSANT